MFIIYSLIYSLLFIFALPFYTLFRKLKRKSSIKLAERLGIRIKKYSAHGEKTIWIHAVSVGEVLAAKPLVMQIRKEYPNIPLIMSVTTETGQAAATSAYGDTVFIINFPFDFGFSVRKYLRIYDPQLVIIMETELWPCFCREVKKASIPLVLINGRISLTSFPHYKRLRFFIKEVLDCFDLLIVQTAQYKERLLELGAASKKIHIAPSLKYHKCNFDIDPKQKEKFISVTGIDKKDIVITGGSTHQGEEEILVNIFKTLSIEQPSLKLIIAPRRPERFGEVESLILKHGLLYKKMSAGEDTKPWRVLLVDRMGELKNCYAVSKIVFVGGSLIKHGGQNLLEAAAFSLPVVFGQHIYNFLESADMLLDSGGGFMVRDEHELRETCAFLLKNKLECETAGKAARSVIDSRQGGLENIMMKIKKYLDN